MNRSTVALVVAAMLIPGALQAAESDDRWYLVPWLGYLYADSDRRADDDFAYGLNLGKPMSPRWNLELGLSRDTLDLETGNGEYKQTGLEVDGLYFFDRNPRFAPYAVIGAGALRTRIRGESDTGVMASAGLGFMAQVNPAVGVRVDLRYRWDDNAGDAFDESSFGDWLVRVGLSIPLGAAPAAAAAPLAAAAPPPAPADSDGDGVPDARDRCPGTPAGASVDAEGCELDSDADGVVDRLDRCPDTKPGERVDRQGCPLAQTIVLRGVNFATDSAELTPDSRAVLDEAVETLKKYPELRVEIAGHTDNVGDRSYNIGLSQRRADAVADYFRTNGVAPGRLTTRGYGPDQPVADNATEAGRLQNRRVELRLQN